MKKIVFLLSLVCVIFNIVACKNNYKMDTGKGFDITVLELWQENIKDKTDNSLVILNEKTSSKILKIKVKNCDDYKVAISLNDKIYKGESILGIAEIAINDISTEEKLFVVKLSANDMKDFKKSLKVKINGENTPLKEFNVKKIKFWGQDIKNCYGLTVNANNNQKTLVIEVSNCNEYEVTARLDGQDYSGNTSSGRVKIAINDVPEQEKKLTIRLTGEDMKSFTKSINVKKINENIELEEFNIAKIYLWGHNIKDETSLDVTIKDTIKTLEIEVSNCDNYEVNVSLGHQVFECDSTSGLASMEITDIPGEETQLIIELSAYNKKKDTKTLRVKRINVDFELSSLNIWGYRFLPVGDKVSVEYIYEPKTFGITVSNCDEYLLKVTFDGVEYTKQATSGNAKIPLENVTPEEKELVIKLSAYGMNDFDRVLKVKRVFTEALDLNVSLKTTDENIEKEIIKDSNYEFFTTQNNAEVIIKTTHSFLSKITINGHNVELSQDKISATHKIDTSNDVVVTVEVEFDDFMKAIRTFKMKKYTNQNEFPFQCSSAKMVPLDDEELSPDRETPLNFNSNNEASVEFNYVKYSCIKLVMNMTKPLTSATLEECIDERSTNYTTQPTEKDMKGIFSGRLKAEIDANGKKTEFNPINNRTYTEYLIVGAGTVEYKIKITSSSGETKNYTVRITNKNEFKLSNREPTDIYLYIAPVYQNYIDITKNPTWEWMTYSKLPINSTNEDYPKKSDLEYMGDKVEMYFAIYDPYALTDIYFYYNIFEDPSSKKHEFIRIKGERKEYFRILKASINPDEKYVDAFVAFRYSLPQGLLPIQTQKPWKKIVEKGFLLQIKNNLAYNEGDRIVKSTDIFSNVFNYRVQSKTVQKNETLNIGIEQDYEDFITGEKKTIKEKPFLSGKVEEGMDYLFMIPTFDGAIGDSIESISYTIQINKPDSETEFESIYGWTDINLTPSKWKNFLCLNAKDDDLLEGEKLVNPYFLFKFCKRDEGKRHIYKIDVTIKPKGSAEQKFMYKLNCKGKETINLMSLKNTHSRDSNLFGLPISYSEIKDRKIHELLKKAMGQHFAREKLISR